MIFGNLHMHLRLKNALPNIGKGLTLASFLLTVPIANWLVQNIGTTCIPNGPCLIPVFPGGITAPSGVLMVGLALVLRDMVQRYLGTAWALVAIAFGCLLSAAFSPTSLVVASATAFLISELADFAVFTPLRRRGFFTAALVSSLVGLVVDSVVFLTLAFGNVDFLLGQVIGKSWMVFGTLTLLWLAGPRQDKGRSAASSS